MPQLPDMPQPTVERPRHEDVTSLQVVTDHGALESITRGEVDMQVATAKRFPRSIDSFRKQALSMATMDQQTAASCFYQLPARRGQDESKTIDGPSIRLAEIVACTWGNLRCEDRIIEVGERHVTAQATVWDMESNVLKRTEVRRRITTKDGRRFGDDMIQVTCAAASSIAFRNAVFDVVPMAHVRMIYLKCRQVAAGDAKSLEQNRSAWFEWFKKAGATEQQVLDLLERKALVEVNLEDLATLTGIANALKDGQTTLEEVFGAKPAEPMPEGKMNLGKKPKGQAEPAAKVEAELKEQRAAAAPPAEEKASPRTSATPAAGPLKEGPPPKQPDDEEW